jgi:UPF0716 protein FxsA
MIPFLFFLLLFTPLIEIAVFIEVGGALGLWPTLAIVILTAMLGTALFRIQGLAVLRQAQTSLGVNQFPAHAVFDGLCLLVAGALLITPGFVTDGFGFLLFLPPFRALLRGLVARRLLHLGRIRTWPGEPDANGGTIEGVYQEVREEETEKPREGPDRSEGG